MFAVVMFLAAPAAAPPSPQVEVRSRAGAGNPGKIVCRKSVETGSIFKLRTICKTQSSWNRSGVERRIEDDYSNEPSLSFDPPAGDQVISTGTANWNELPPLKLRGRLPYVQLVLTVEDLLKKGSCKLAGQTYKSFDIDVRFAVRVAPGGRATQVVVADTGCAALDTMVGLTIFARSKRGDIEPEATPARWFGGTMNFTVR